MGVIAYVAIQILAGKAQEVNMVMWIIFALMSMFYLGQETRPLIEWILSHLN